jgi:hypothetical protein
MTKSVNQMYLDSSAEMYNLCLAHNRPTDEWQARMNYYTEQIELDKLAENDARLRDE